MEIIYRLICGRPKKHSGTHIQELGGNFDLPVYLYNSVQSRFLVPLISYIQICFVLNSIWLMANHIVVRGLKNRVIVQDV